MGGGVSSNSGSKSLQPLVDGDSVETIAGPTQVPEQAEQIEAEIVQRPASTQPFRFLDLPQEIQEMVYNIVIAARKRHGEVETALALCSFAIPSLAQTNHQISTDFLHAFFKQTKFNIWIGPYKCHETPCDLWTKWSHDKGRLFKAIAAAEDPLDPIYLTSRVSALIDPTMVFHNVTFLLNELYCPQGLQLALWKDCWYARSQRIGGHQYATLALQWCNRGGITWGTPTTGITEDAQSRNIEPVLPSLWFAEDISCREGFKGFTVEDLRRIAIKMVTGYGKVEVGDAKVEKRRRQWSSSL